MTGITLTKLDGTAKGGVIFSVAVSSAFRFAILASASVLRICVRLMRATLLRHFCPRGLRMIRFEQVSKAYLGGRQALQG